jgi:hypothetical protein
LRTKLALLLVLAACDDGAPVVARHRHDAGSVTEAGVASTGDAVSAGPVEDGGMIESSGETPLLERAGAHDYDCSVSRAAALLPNLAGPGNQVEWQGALVADENQLYLASTPKSLGAEELLWWSPIDLGGKLGAATSVRSSPAIFVSGLSVASNGGVVTFAWAEVGMDLTHSIWLAQVDTGGSLLAAPYMFTTTSSKIPGFDSQATGSPRLLPGAAGPALLYVEGSELSSVRLVFLNSTGVRRGPAKVLSAGSMQYKSLDLVATDSGFGALYASFDGSWSLHYQALDTHGNARGLVHTLALDSDDGRLLARGDDVLAVWSEDVGVREPGMYQRAILVARLDGEGHAIGGSQELGSGGIDQVDTEPRWLDMSDDVGLLWSHGSAIYECGGCYPDNKLRFVVLDGHALTPRSDLVEFASPIADGLTRPESIRQGDDVLVVAAMTGHTTSRGASAALHCSR